MKKAFLIIFTLAAYTTSFAQVDKNTAKKKETVITKTAVKSEKGTDVSTKTVSQTSKQALTLDNTDANQTNQSVVLEPIKMNTDVSYSYDGNRFIILNQKDKDGYRMINVKDNETQEEYAIIKPTSQNGYYIMSKEGKTSFGYFNTEGNFVVERYDSNVDAVVSDIYKLQMKADTMNKD
jgi:hypothetical protein